MKEPTIQRLDALWRIPGRLAYVVNHSYPYSSNGYAVRTHGVAKALFEHGHSVVVINKPGNPWDLSDFDERDYPLEKKIDGIQYLYLPNPSIRKLNTKQWNIKATEALLKVFQIFKPSVVMAASNWENALPAMKAARILELPFYYEVRGFWEITRISREPEWEKTTAFKYQVEQESYIAINADHVFTLNKFMSEELNRRGVKESSIDILQNSFNEQKKDFDSSTVNKASLGITTKYVVGYIGSFNHYEGLNDLLLACSELLKKGKDISLLLIGSSNQRGLRDKNDGSCIQSKKLNEYAQRIDFKKNLFILNRMLPEELSNYYSLIDLIVIPRLPLPVCNLVSPLKPFEALSHNKYLLVSDVPPLKYISNQMESVYLFKAGNVQALENKINSILEKGFKKRKTQDTFGSWLETTETLSNKINELPATFSSNKKSLSSYEIDDVTSLNETYNVLSIMDKFTEECFSPEYNLIPLDKNTWNQQIKSNNIEFFFAESVWRGNGGMWNYCMTKFSGKYGNELKKVLKVCKDNKIPSVFWNKEDPVNFDIFIDVAKEFDYIFTTDSGCISRYKSILGHDRVFLLQFSAQPILHNPILKKSRNKKIAFAGSWAGHKYPLRAKRLEVLLEKPSILSVLDIYDRNSELNDTKLQFPSKYNACIHQAMPYKDLCESIYKEYAALVNVNSVENSSSMLARRIFELSACATPIISSPSLAISGDFKEVVIVVKTKEEMSIALNDVLSNELNGLRRGVIGSRLVHSKHTYRHRANVINETIGLPKRNNNIIKPLTAICVSKRPEFLHKISHMLNEQTYPDLRVIFVIHNNEFNESEIRTAFNSKLRLEVLRLPSEGTFLADGLNLAIKNSKTEFLAKIDDDDFYGPNYFTDAMLAFTYTKSGLVGKASYFCFSEERNQLALRFPSKHYRYFDRVHGGTFVWNRLRTGEQYFKKVRQGTDSAFLRSLKEKGVSIFSSDPFNFVHNRYANLNQHTWKITDDEFMKNTTVIAEGLDLSYVVL